MASYSCLYIFLDEGGNFDFSSNGTKKFTITAVSMTRPFTFYEAFTSLKYDLIEEDLDLEYFHAAEDRQNVRGKVFEIISDHLPNIRIDTVVVDKRKTNPSFREVDKFYPKMLGYLLRYLCTPENLSKYSAVIVTTDAIPVKKKRKAVEKAIKIVLSEVMKPIGKHYRVLHHASKSGFGLQVADYCNWAIYRKWEIQDMRSYGLINSRIKSEFDIFESGQTLYY
ncbi:MAG: DUF3800 domain-containing protein [Sedimentisphaerales bacterium]|nr:DUF3800 domain-containing protein [Sedimentisphaerales bacterium]